MESEAHFENRTTPGPLSQPVHIIASPFKTGSTSVGRALLALGVGTREMPYNGELLRENQRAIRAANKLVEKGFGFKIFRQQHEAEVLERLASLLSAIQPFDVFHDAPFGHNHIHPFVRKVLAPKAKFIWVAREPQDWLDSVRRWEQSHPETYKRHAEWDIDPAAEAELRMKRWRKSFRGFKRMRRGAPRDCFVLEWSDMDSYEALAGFYGVAAPNVPFPKENNSR